MPTMTVVVPNGPSGFGGGVDMSDILAVVLADGYL